MNKYYVYAHLDLRGEIFYIGKGADYRAYIKTGRSSDWNNKASGGYSVQMLYRNLDKETALEIETEMIELYSSKIVNKVVKFRNLTIKYEELKEVFEYNENSETCLIRTALDKNDRNGLSKIGVAGYKVDRYFRVKFKGNSFPVHRIIWVLCNKQDLSNDYVIDHLDGNRFNNKINNLRKVTQRDNMSNLRNDRKNLTSTGVMGVYWEDDLKRWRVGYRIEGASKRKAFNPRTLYPNLPEDLAKAKALNDAIDFRKQMEALYYNKPEM